MNTRNRGNNYSDMKGLYSYEEATCLDLGSLPDVHPLPANHPQPFMTSAPCLYTRLAVAANRLVIILSTCRYVVCGTCTFMEASPAVIPRGDVGPYKWSELLDGALNSSRDLCGFGFIR